jgi:hypothetical protein
MLSAAICALTAMAQSTNSGSDNWGSVRAAMGMSGQVTPEGLLKIEFTDPSLTLTVKDVTLKPETVAFGEFVFTSFNNGTSATITPGTPATANGLCVGEFPVRVTKVSETIQNLERSGIQISAVHKHVFDDNPRIAFVHVEQAGDLTTIAKQLAFALKRSGLNYMEGQPEKARDEQGLDVDDILARISSAAPLKFSPAAQLSGASGTPDAVEAQLENGVLSIAMPRAEIVTECAGPVYDAMQQWSAGSSGTTTSNTAPAPGMGNLGGVGTTAWITCLVSAVQAELGGSAASGSANTTKQGNQVSAASVGAEIDIRMQPIGNGQVAATAEVPLLPSEVDNFIRVISESRTAKFTYGEAHNHTKYAAPILVFLHLTATGDPMQIAEVLRAAIANNAQVAAGSTSGSYAIGYGNQPGR